MSAAYCAFWQCWGSWTGCAGVSMAGCGVRPDLIFEAFEWVCKDAGVEGLTFPMTCAIRRFRGSLMRPGAYVRGFDKRDKTMQMLKRYTHLRAEDLVGILG